MSSKLKDAIREMVIRRGNVTFAELATIPGFEGGIEHYLADDRLNFDILIWPGISQQAMAALDELCRETAIAAAPCNALCYLLDGLMPRVEPVRASLTTRVKPFKKRKTFWQPIHFNTYARVKERDRISLRFEMVAAT